MLKWVVKHSGHSGRPDSAGGQYRSVSTDRGIAHARQRSTDSGHSSTGSSSGCAGQCGSSGGQQQNSGNHTKGQWSIDSGHSSVRSHVLVRGEESGQRPSGDKPHEDKVDHGYVRKSCDESSVINSADTKVLSGQWSAGQHRCEHDTDQCKNTPDNHGHQDAEQVCSTEQTGGSRRPRGRKKLQQGTGKRAKSLGAITLRSLKAAVYGHRERSREKEQGPPESRDDDKQGQVNGAKQDCGQCLEKTPRMVLKDSQSMQENLCSYNDKSGSVQDNGIDDTKLVCDKGEGSSRNNAIESNNNVKRGPFTGSKSVQDSLCNYKNDQLVCNAMKVNQDTLTRKYAKGYRGFDKVTRYNGEVNREDVNRRSIGNVIVHQSPDSKDHTDLNHKQFGANNGDDSLKSEKSRKISIELVETSNMNDTIEIDLPNQKQYSCDMIGGDSSNQKVGKPAQNVDKTVSRNQYVKSNETPQQRQPQKLAVNVNSPAVNGHDQYKLVCGISRESFKVTDSSAGNCDQNAKVCDFVNGGDDNSLSTYTAPPHFAHIQSLEKLTDFRDVTKVAVESLSPDLDHDEGIEDNEFDPSVITGSKVSMMDESFEADDAASKKTGKISDQVSVRSSGSSSGRSENGDSSTDSAVIMDQTDGLRPHGKQTLDQGDVNIGTSLMKADITVNEKDQLEVTHLITSLEMRSPLTGGNRQDLLLGQHDQLQQFRASLQGFCDGILDRDLGEATLDLDDFDDYDTNKMGLKLCHEPRAIAVDGLNLIGSNIDRDNNAVTRNADDNENHVDSRIIDGSDTNYGLNSDCKENVRNGTNRLILGSKTLRDSDLSNTSVEKECLIDGAITCDNLSSDKCHKSVGDEQQQVCGNCRKCQRTVALESDTDTMKVCDELDGKGGRFIIHIGRPAPDKATCCVQQDQDQIQNSGITDAQRQIENGIESNMQRCKVEGGRGLKGPKSIKGDEEGSIMGQRVALSKMGCDTGRVSVKVERSQSSDNLDVDNHGKTLQNPPNQRSAVDKTVRYLPIVLIDKARKTDSNADVEDSKEGGSPRRPSRPKRQAKMADRHSSVGGADWNGYEERSVDGVNRFMRGSDPLAQTARGKLQNRRMKLNEQINLELRLRAGAENLYKATTNKKLRETVALELSYVNSTLQLLKEELADLNSSMAVYQNHGTTQCAPMIPLGLKETKDVDLIRPLKEMLRDHYYEDEEKFESQLQHLANTRSACRTPVRNEEGVHLLYEYYNQLFFIDRRFFPPYKSLGVYFEWFDSLTGVPSAQRTVGFEKGSVLFNIGALHTQIAARQDRSQRVGVDKAIENFRLAAGALQYLNDNFSNAPSTDMQPDTLNMLRQLMLSQCQECVFERCVLGSDIKADLASHVTVAHEAAQVGQVYQHTRRLMLFDSLKDVVPPSWISMVTVKSEYFRALSHYHTALGLLYHAEADTSSLVHVFETLYEVTDTSAGRKLRGGSDCHLLQQPPTTREQRMLYAKAHLRQSILSHEEALRVHGLSRQLRRIDTFHDILKLSHDQSLQLFGELEEEDDFTELTEVPNITGRSKQMAAQRPPDFVKHKVSDLFHCLGSLAIFSARHDWTSPRRIELIKASGEEYGFSVRGDSPVIIAAVETNSIAQKHGLCVGDFIVAVGKTEAKWQRHEDVVNAIRTAGSKLSLTVVTPVNKNFLSPGNSKDGDSAAKARPAPTSTQPRPRSAGSNQRHGSGSATWGPKDKARRASQTSSKSSGGGWTLRRRSKSRDKQREVDSTSLKAR